MKKLLLSLVAMLYVMLAWPQGPSLNEGFEGVDFPPQGWTNINVAGPSSPWTRSTAYAHTGVASAYANYNYVGSVNYLISPLLVINSADDSISFWARMDVLSSSNNQTYLKIYVSSTGSDVADFEDEPILDISASYTGDNQITDVWKRWSISLEDYLGEEVYIAFRQSDTDGYALCLDDIEGPEISVPSCAKPRNISLSSITSYSIDIGFEPGNQSDNAWYVYSRIEGMTGWDSVHCSDNPYTLMGLNSDTRYEIMIRTDCGDELSEASDIHMFRTDCDIISNLPWMDDFDSYGTYFVTRPDCWSFPVLHDHSPYLVAAHSNSPPASLKFESPMDVYTYAITPQFADDINELRVKFFLKAEYLFYSGEIEVGVMSDNMDTSTFELVETIQPDNTNYNQYEVEFSNTALAGPNRYIAFRHSTNNTICKYWLDDVEVSLIPDCRKPRNILVPYVIATGANIHWEPGSTDDYAWRLYYREYGSNDWDTVYAISNPYTITDLEHNTRYELKIRTDCGDELSEESAMISFRTDCAIVEDLPWMDDFDTYDTIVGGRPNCWSFPIIHNQYPCLSTVPISVSSSPSSLMFQSSTGIHTYAITPEFAEDINSLRVRFKMKGAPNSISGFMTIGVMSDNTDINTFEAVETIQPINTEFNEYEVAFENTVLSGPNNYIVFRHSADTEHWYYFLDDVEVSKIPDCRKPEDILFSNITIDEAYVSWLPGNTDDDLWWIYYREAGNSEWDSADVADMPYNISGLSERTEYEVCIRTVCGDEISEPSLIFSFTTPCEPIDGFTGLPWEESFESLDAAGDIPDCWQASTLGFNANTQIVNSAWSNKFARTGTGSAFFNQAYSNSFTTAPFFLYEGEEYEFSFWYITCGSYNFSILKGVLNNPDGTTKTIGDSIQSPMNTAYEEYFGVFEVEEDGYYTIDIANEATSTIAGILTFDDVALGINPSCSKPRTIRFDTITTTSVEIGWSVINADNNLWRIYYKKAFENEWDSVITSNNPYTLTSLSPSTKYEIKIVTDCGIELSEESGIVELRTECGALSSFPWKEDFDGYGYTSGTRPDCWCFPVTNYVYPALYSAYSTSPYLSLTSKSPAGSSTYAVTPQLAEDINELMVSFQLKVDDIVETGTLEVGVMSNAMDTSTFETVEIIQPSNTNFNEYEVGFENTVLSGPNNYIAFKHNPNIDFSFLYIDDVIIDYPPTCLRPSEISVVNTTTTTAQLSWTPGSQNDARWWIIYREQGETDWDSVSANTNLYTLTNLSLGTYYEVVIRADCENEVSKLSANYFFNTSCYDGPISDIPWEESFEQGIVCWEQKHTGGSVNLTDSSGQYIPRTGTGFASFHETEYGLSSTMLISPQIDLSSVPSPYLSFWYVQKVRASHQDELKVYYRQSTTSQWIELKHYIDNTPNYAFDSIALPNPSSTYQIAFEGLSYYGCGIAIDDIRVYNEYRPAVLTNQVVVDNIERIAKFSGIITENIEPISSRGFEYKKDEEDWLDAEDIIATGISTITATTPVLDNEQRYSVRAYAETAQGRAYGNVEEFEITSSLNALDVDDIEISLHPNPATSTTTISIKGIDGKAIISIIDIQGRVITSINRSSNASEIKHIFNLRDLSKGVYHIRVSTDNVVRIEKLIVK